MHSIVPNKKNASITAGSVSLQRVLKRILSMAQRALMVAMSDRSSDYELGLVMPGVQGPDEISVELPKWTSRKVK